MAWHDIYILQVVTETKGKNSKQKQDSEEKCAEK